MGIITRQKILFLNDFYYPKPMPNGICLHSVAKELIKAGCDVHVIAYKRNGQKAPSSYEGVKIHYIKMRLFYILRTYGEDHIQSVWGKMAILIAKPLNKIAKLFLLHKFPMASSITVNRYYKKAVGLCQQHKFDAVIALFNPEDTLFAGVKLKKRFPEIKLGAYILDSLIFLSGKKKLPPFLRDKLSWRFEKLVYENYDMVYNMETHKIHHQIKKYETYKHKMLFLDTPLFTPRQPLLTKELYSKDKKHLVYMGTLFKTFRNPDYMYRLFLEANKNHNYILHFYTRGDCESDVINYHDKTNGAVVRHGYVSHSEIDNIYANADFLINLGVSNSTNISSKIFDYMSIGKPIIHFYYLDDDVNLQYFQKYDLALMIKMDEDLFYDNAVNLKYFLEITYNKTVDSKALVKTFRKNLPGYTAHQFKTLAGISNQHKQLEFSSSL
jgi:glycosyltransferase involved in cell wall biosynthesis